MEDWRNIINGDEIPSLCYSDQPYIISNGETLLCCMTTSIGHEGVKGQKIIVQRSHDDGKTWTHMCSMEEDNAPENSYSVLLKTNYGRVYCFYNFNKDNIRKVKADQPPFKDGYCYRVDSQGYYAFRYSDDFGLTWSNNRYYVPIRNFEIDENNAYQGKIQFFWNVGKPLIDGNTAYLSIHKVGGFGKGFFTKSEGVLIKSNNIMCEHDVTKLHFETLPEGKIGIRAPKGGGPISEEHSYVLLDDSSFFTVFRTTDGKSACAYSHDKGKSFEPSTYMPVKHPRAANFVWKISNGKYLYWFHNHGGTSYEGRNPVFCLIGEEIKGVINWSEPEILLYHDDPIVRISYPDFIELNNKYYISETEKDKARLHEIDSIFIDKVSQFSSYKSLCLESLLLQTNQLQITLPHFNSFTSMDVFSPNRSSKDNRIGYTFDITIDFQGEDVTVMNSFDDNEKGIKIEIKNNRVNFLMSDGQYMNSFVSDVDSIKKGLNHISVIIDGGPKIIIFVINGKFNDGKKRQYGFGRFASLFSNFNGVKEVAINRSIKSIRIYDRAILTCEAVGNYRFECYNN